MEERGLHTFVLNSKSQYNLCFSFFAIHVSPSSRTIFPKRIPRAYIFGIVIIYSGRFNQNLELTLRN